MKKWQRTVVSWIDGCLNLKTNVPITDWPDSEKRRFHSYFGLIISSQPKSSDIFACIRIRRGCVSPEGEQAELLIKKLREIDPLRQIEVMQKGEYFLMKISSHSGEQLCKAAILIGSRIFQTLEMGENRKLHIAHFRIFQETLFLVQNEWIPYADYLREKLGLPKVYLTKSDKLSLVHENNRFPIIFP